MTDLKIEEYGIPAADLGPENPLPVFRNADPNIKVGIDPSVPPDDARYLGWQVGFRTLPHRMQDGYSRNRQPRAFRAVVLENDFVRATILPEVGGRMVSLFYKPHKRELLDRNPVFQPANLALRNAWFSGGVEWNTSHFGHYYLTCSPVFATKIEGAGYPVLRIYEWDRVKGFPWQIDFHLPPDSHFIFTRVRLVNPNAHELPMYWWTNMAVPEAPGVRTICPAETSLHTTNGTQVSQMNLPRLTPETPGVGKNFPAEGVEMTYGSKLPSSREFFFQIPETQRRWIAALDKDGTGFVHASTPRLRGRKVFYWGMNPGGRRWQEFLSAPGRAYLEIQAGLSRSQIECLPMPAQTEWAWTEAFGYLQADAQKVHSENWSEVWRAADTALNVALPQEHIDALDREFARTGTVRGNEMILRGSGWGALERKRLELQKQPDRIPQELYFDESGEDQAPWLTLLERGYLPARDPQRDPGQAMVQPEWKALLEKSVQTEPLGDHWLAWYHLGIMRLEAGDNDGARRAWEKSLHHQRSGWTLRNLAVLAARTNNDHESTELLKQAWECGPQIAALAVEYGAALVKEERFDELRRFASELPESIRSHERLRIFSARAALHAGAFEEVEQLFAHDFATVREGEVTLTDIWFALQEKKLAASEKVPVDEALKKRVRLEFPPPPNIDFRMILDIS